MLSFEFERDLIDAIGKALAGNGIKPTWVLGFLEPVIEKHCSGAGEEDRLRRAAQEWIAYYDKYGAREFNRQFGTKEVHGDEFIEFLREFLAAGETSKLPDVGKS